MADKQNRYRQRKTDQGLKRVEVLVPSESVPHLKAYARALRDASQLGLIPPTFEGMTRKASPQFQHDTTFVNSHSNKTIPDDKQKSQYKTHIPDFRPYTHKQSGIHILGGV
jgi:hypothetical protein